MKIGIITIGNELIWGTAVNTWGAFMAQALTEKGFEVAFLTSIPDDEREITDTLLRSSEDIVAVVITGCGNGTVVHSIYKTIAQCFPESSAKGKQENFYLDANERLQEIETFSDLPAATKIPPTLPENATGFFLRQGGRVYIYFPYLSSESQTVFREKIIPFLEKKDSGNSAFQSKTLKIFGLPRKVILDLLEGIHPEDFSASLDLSPSFPEQHIRITSRGKYAEEVEKNIQGLEKVLRGKLLENIFGVDQETLEGVVGQLLRSIRSTLATAESCTGGLVAHRLTNIAGSSDYFDRGIVAYSNRAKIKNLNVPQELLAAYGAVSAPVAEKMAEGILRVSQATLGLSITGIAGPGGGSPEKPVGTVFIALASPQATISRKYHFAGSREEIKTVTAHTALDMVRRYLIQLN